MNPKRVHRFFGYPLLCAKSRQRIASQTWSASAVPKSAGGGRSGATKASPER